ncbi:MAG: peptide chain release factor 1 [Thermoguttaceae bacterium]
MRKVLEEKLARFEELERQLLDPEVLASPARLSAIARQHGEVAKVATKYRRLKQLNAQIAEAMELSRGTDPEMRQLAEAELPELKRERDRLWTELLDLTIGGEDAHRNRCVLEIRAGTGGDEAALFARDLFEMYRRYAEARGWKFEVLSMNPTELGGFKEVYVGIEGEGAFQQLQHESGGHRVQRVPQTEAQGRIHTSAATVAVLPEPEEVEIELKPEDYRIDRFSASGPGGQHVNKTISAVRLTHFASGIVVSCQDEKSQHKNLAKALRVLKSRLYEAKRRQEQAKRASQRRGIIGSGDRSERIRTYNFPQNRVTDHRINLTLYQLDRVLAGDLDPILEAIKEAQRQQLRDQFGAMD